MQLSPASHGEVHQEGSKVDSGATLASGLSSLLGTGPRTQAKQSPAGLIVWEKLLGGQTECYQEGQSLMEKVYIKISKGCLFFLFFFFSFEEVKLLTFREVEILTRLNTLWRRKWQPTPVFLPGEFHGQRSLVGYSPQVTKSRTRLSDFTSLNTLWLFSLFTITRHL